MVVDSTIIVLCFLVIKKFCEKKLCEKYGV